jgi:hypothetical protein
MSEVFRALRHAGIGRGGSTLAGVLCGLAMALPAHAQDGRLPPREAWRASSSSSQVKAQAIGYPIGGDAATRIGGWGISIFKMEPLGEAASARLRGVPANAAALWQGGAALAMPDLEARW